MDKLVKRKLLKALNKEFSFMNLEECKLVLKRDYYGNYSNRLEFIKNLIRQSHLIREKNAIPDYLENYIDWKRMANDLFKTDYYSIKLAGEKGIFVFNKIDF